jgi:hypothetical protein
VCHRDSLEVGGLGYAVLLYVCVRFGGSCLVEEMGWTTEMGKEMAFLSFFEGVGYLFFFLSFFSSAFSFFLFLIR